MSTQVCPVREAKLWVCSLTKWNDEKGDSSLFLLKSPPMVPHKQSDSLILNSPWVFSMWKIFAVSFCIDGHVQQIFQFIRMTITFTLVEWVTLTHKYEEKKPNKRNCVWEVCVSICICPKDISTFLWIVVYKLFGLWFMVGNWIKKFRQTVRKRLRI